MGQANTLVTNISVSMSGDVTPDKARSLGRTLKSEFNKNLKDQMRPGGLLFKR